MIQTTERKLYLSRTDLEKELSSFNINSLLKSNGYQNKPLSFEEAYLLGVFTLATHRSDLTPLLPMDVRTATIQSVAALCSLHNKALYEREGSAVQIAGICASVFDYDIGVSRNGFVHPHVEEVMDNCGMGGDLYRTPNLSTIAALIAAAAGVNMLKHGSPGNTDSTGSSDFLKYCGVNLFASKDSVERAIEITHFGYTDALDEGYKLIHTQTHGVARLAHMNDIIGPITNPAYPQLMKKRVVGVNHLIPPERIAQAYLILNEKRITNLERGLFVRGFADKERNGGIDEIGLMEGGTIVAELNGPEIKTYDLFAKDFGLSEMTVSDLDPGTRKAETSKLILQGEITDKRRDAALANAAILFYLKQDLTFKEGTVKARDILNTGRPYQVLAEYSELTNRG